MITTHSTHFHCVLAVWCMIVFFLYLAIQILAARVFIKLRSNAYLVSVTFVLAQCLCPFVAAVQFCVILVDLE